MSEKQVISEYIRKTPYSEQLQDPRWKDFCRRFRDSRGNACQYCKLTNAPLEVHHKFYLLGRQAWEYEFNDMILVCKRCHRGLHALAEFVATPAMVKRFAASWDTPKKTEVPDAAYFADQKKKLWKIYAADQAAKAQQVNPS